MRTNNEPPHLDTRISLWKSISEFYLDNTLDNDDYARIADTFTRSGYSLSEIKEIDLHEVFPSLYKNLLLVSGEWSGFDEEWLIKECTMNYQRKEFPLFRLFSKIQNRYHRYLTEEHWNKVELAMNTSSN